MPEKPPDARELGYYFSLAQVGLEMAVPIGLGVLLDQQFGWMPWGAVAGAILGLLVAFFHLITMLNRQGPRDAGRPDRDSQ